MKWRLELLFLSLVTIGLSKEEKRKTLIIAVDETNPEKSDAVISNLDLQEQSSSPVQRVSGQSYGNNGLQMAPIDKELGYMIVTQEELKRLQNVDGITVEEPRHITYPSSNSEENYDTSTYPQSELPLPIRSSYPESPQTDSHEYYNSPGELNKYPERPAPLLSSLSSSNSSLTGYGPLSDPHYNSPPSNHYRSYGFEESEGPSGSYGSAPYYVNNFPISESPYGNSPEHAPHYENDYPPQTEYAPNSGPYESYPADKNTDPHYRPMYSGYKPPPTSSYDSKYEPGPTYSSEPKPPKYKYYTNPQTTNEYTDDKHVPSSKPYSSPYETKFSEPPYRAVGRPLTDTSAPNNHYYKDNSSPMSYDTSYYSPSGPNSYGSRTNYSSSSPPYAGSHSSPHINSDFGPQQYSLKDSPYASKNSYTGRYNSESNTGLQLLYGDSEKYPYKSPKSSYNNSPGIYSYGVVPSPESSKDYPPQSYKSPSLKTYDSTKYPEKPHSTSYDQSPKQDPAAYEMYGIKKFPSKYKSLSDERAYGSSQSSPNTRSSYKPSGDPAIVTRFYETPTQKSSGFNFKYPESLKSSPLEKPKYYDSPKPVSKSTHLDAPQSYKYPLKTELTKKNYKTSRPAPQYDEYEQPRYPPLPGEIPYSSSEKDSHEQYTDYNSKEQNVNHRTIGNSHYGKSYPSAYNPSSYDSDYTNSKSHSNYPAQNGSTYHSNHSSHEVDNEPIIYTKTYTKTFSKPYTDSPSVAHYYEHSSENPYNAPSNKDSSPSNYYPPAEMVNSHTSSSQYPKPYSKSSGESSYSKPSEKKRKKFRYNSQDYNSKSLPTHVSESELPKRVVGVVYRSRKTLPSLRSTRHKNYLSYKAYNPESSPAVDYKVYENAPEKHFTEPPLKNAIKLKYRPLKKGSFRENFKEETDDDSYENDVFANIPGEAGKDFPILKEIPQTYFSCHNRASGFYADVENRCQVYHQCSDNGHIQSFLCPNGTIFNQVTFVCEWWHNVDCTKSEHHFDRNNYLYQTSTTSTLESEPFSRPPHEHHRGEKDAGISKYVKSLPRKTLLTLSRI